MQEANMKKTMLTILTVILTAALVFPGNSELDKETKAITAAAMDYMDGAHDGDASRIERSVHHELTKVSLRKLPNSDVTFLSKAGFSRLQELVRANMVPLPKEKRNIKVEVFSVKKGLACAKAVSAQFYDYLQLAKIDGKWKLINVLFTGNSGVGEKEQAAHFMNNKQAIKQAALDYIEGFFSGDADRVRRAVHPELTKVVPITLKQTGKTMLNKMGAGFLIEGARMKVGLVKEEDRNIKITIFDVMKDIAIVEVTSSEYVDYLQLGNVNGQWKIINVLWQMNRS